MPLPVSDSDPMPSTEQSLDSSDGRGGSSPDPWTPLGGDLSRVLAVDYGERRVGLALSDPTRTLASPLPTLLRRKGKRAPLHAMAGLAAEHGVGVLVIGLPLTLSGEDSPWTREVRDMGAALATRTGLPVHFVDERMTSVQAERVVRGGGLPRGEREKKERIDAAAATLILQTWLDRERSR
jgi:putative holliday junction resolvase